ncbi:MAG: VCBS repeat-containing protein [Pirellulales bacterium]
MSKNKDKRVFGRFSFFAILLAFLAGLIWVRTQPFSPSLYRFAGVSYPKSIHSFERTPLPTQPQHVLAQYTHVQVIDVDQDGKNEVIACDAINHCIRRFAYVPNEGWKQEVLIADVSVPAHATFVDINSDNELDCFVSVLGDIFPSDEAVGRVELFLREGKTYVRHVILEDIRRVADAQPADFDGDGDIDLAVAVFGYSRGEILWLENLGNGTFADHRLHGAPGSIHVPVAGLDGGGDPDFATIVSQDDEELWGFENLGDGTFRSRMLWRTSNFDFGSAGLIATDLDSDGDPDFILPVGDNLEDFAACPQPYHGCYWFENNGDWSFKKHRIADLAGTYAASAGDIDNDGDMDVALVSMANDWQESSAASLVWLENDGHQNFSTWQVASQPIHLTTIDVGDIDGDAQPDFVAGGLHLRPPFDRVGGVTAWINKGE